VARCAKGEDVSRGDALGLQNQVSGQDVTRQVAVEVQDPGSTGDDSPKNCYQQNVFNSWEEKTKQFHKTYATQPHKKN
jgi:hypothetical protein